MTDEAPPESFGVFMCSKPTVAQSTNPVARDLRTEFRDLVFDVCRVKEDYNEGGFRGLLERQFGTVQDLIADVFTGRGLHPTIGGIVPESGTAFGVALNDEWHIRETPHIRFTTSVEARGSESGFWAAGAVSHETELPILLDLPVAYGLTLSAQATALYATSNPSRAFVDTFSDSSAPGIRARTTYAVPGLIATYRSPDALYGLSGEARVSYEAYQALAGGSFSFDRFEARMAVNYGLDDRWSFLERFPTLRSLVRTSRFSGEANLVISEPRAHSAVPFYLQPTLGGGDIHNENWLRSYTNYRFRAPNMVAYGVTYERRLIDPFGFFIFAQWGKVGLDVGELDFDRLKHSIGFGIALRLGGRAVAEVSFAWGGGEGGHTYATGNTNNAIGFGARAAGSVGLRGVF